MQSLNANYSGGIIIGSQVLGGSISFFPIYPVRWQISMWRPLQASGGVSSGFSLTNHQFFCGEELYDKKNTLSMCIKHEVTPT